MMTVTPKAQTPNVKQQMFFMINPNFKLGEQKHFNRYLTYQLPSSFHAVCKKCGESHYLNEQGKMQVNGYRVSQCITCAFNEKGLLLW